jgi:outer membrane receptor protein involved in Fe transport
MKFDVRLSVLNVLDQAYISDAQNNDRYVGQSWNSFDARSAAVFFGMGRRFMTSLAISF